MQLCSLWKINLTFSLFGIQITGYLKKRGLSLSARVKRHSRAREHRWKYQLKHLLSVDFSGIDCFSLNHGFYCSQLILLFWGKGKRREIGIGTLYDIYANIFLISFSFFWIPITCSHTFMSIRVVLTFIFAISLRTLLLHLKVYCVIGLPRKLCLES